MWEDEHDSGNGKNQVELNDHASKGKNLLETVPLHSGASRDEVAHDEREVGGGNGYEAGLVEHVLLLLVQIQVICLGSVWVADRVVDRAEKQGCLHGDSATD